MGAKHICILGGSGFVGRHLLARLRLDGHKAKILTRSSKVQQRLFCQMSAECVIADVYDEASLRREFAGCDTVVNLIGILNERGHDGREFSRTHAELPRTVAVAARAAGVGQILHMSALGASSDAPSQYLRSKAAGSAALIEALGPEQRWTIFMPSVIFGHDDSLTRRFEFLLRWSPLLPLACPGSRFAPVFINDVVDAFARVLDESEAHGQFYALCGPEEITLLELVRAVRNAAGLHRLIVPLPDALARLQANLMEYLPGKPFSLDNYRSAQRPSVCDGSLPGFKELGIEPSRFSEVLPSYL